MQVMCISNVITLFIYRMFMHFAAPIADIVKCAGKVFVSRIASGL